jgi:hypothetical protein
MGEIIADPMSDFLPTDKGTLSVYLVENNKQYIDRVIAAMAATRQDVDKFEYAIVELQDLESRGFETEIQLGTTPDEEVNRWHLNIVKLSTQKILDLTHLFFQKSVPDLLGRRYKEDVEALLRENVQFFNAKKVTQPKIRKFLNLIDKS